jgi:predicted amidophosphoribosyltransferase
MTKAAPCFTASRNDAEWEPMVTRLGRGAAIKYPEVREVTVCRCCGNWFEYMRRRRHRVYCDQCRENRVHEAMRISYE